MPIEQWVIGVNSVINNNKLHFTTSPLLTGVLGLTTCLPIWVIYATQKLRVQFLILDFGNLLFLSISTEA